MCDKIITKKKKEWSWMSRHSYEMMGMRKESYSYVCNIQMLRYLSYNIRQITFFKFLIVLKWKRILYRLCRTHHMNIMNIFRSFNNFFSFFLLLFFLFLSIRSHKTLFMEIFYIFNRTYTYFNCVRRQIFNNNKNEDNMQMAAPF